MPKIISDAKDRILETTKKQLDENGYEALSLRSIASESHLSVGTIYNYFSCKDELIAAVILNDWIQVLNQMDAHIQSISSLEDGFLCIHQNLCAFYEEYRKLFAQAQETISAVQTYHGMLIHQIEERIHHLYVHFNETEQSEYMTLLAELILISATKQTISFSSFKTLIHRLTRKETTYEQL